MKRSVPLIAIAAASTTLLSGCPPTYDIMLGNWIFDVTFIIYPSVGFELKEDGSARSFATSPSSGSLGGDWQWESNGRTLRIQDVSADDGWIFEGRLHSETAASGDIRRANEFQSFAVWEARFSS